MGVLRTRRSFHQRVRARNCKVAQRSCTHIKFRVIAFHRCMYSVYASWKFNFPLLYIVCVFGLYCELFNNTHTHTHFGHALELLLLCLGWQRFIIHANSLAVCSLINKRAHVNFVFNARGRHFSENIYREPVYIRYSHAGFISLYCVL